MIGWIGNIADLFSGLGVTGAIMVAQLLVIGMMYRIIATLLQTMRAERKSLVDALDKSTDAQLQVSRILAGIEAKLGLR